MYKLSYRTKWAEDYGPDKGDPKPKVRPGSDGPDTGADLANHQRAVNKANGQRKRQQAQNERYNTQPFSAKADKRTGAAPAPAPKAQDFSLGDLYQRAVHSPGAYAMGGAGLGALAAHGLGVPKWLGALLGGGAGYFGSDYINGALGYNGPTHSTSYTRAAFPESY